MDRNFLEIVHKNNQFPTFQKPTVVGFYSLDINRTYHSTADNLKYLYRMHPNVKLDLNEGFNVYQEKKNTTENEEKIDSLLSWIIANKYVMQNNRSPKPTFICYRGLLTTVMRTPYENQEDWLICAVKVQNAIFLCAFYTEDKKRKIEQGTTTREKLFEFWGRKFEQYMLSDHPHQKPDLSRSVNANEEFDLVYRSKLNDHYILYGAEMDGVDSPEPVVKSASDLNRRKFVELKTSRLIENERQHRNFKKFKLIKWWSQSFLVGIDNITCGFRDDRGIVHQLTEFKTRDLPKLSNGLWSACVCFSFLDDFLSFVESCLRKEEDLCTWKFYWKPGNSRVHAEKDSNSSVYCILPNWSVNHFTLNAQQE